MAVKDCNCNEPNEGDPVQVIKNLSLTSPKGEIQGRDGKNPLILEDLFLKKA